MRHFQKQLHIFLPYIAREVRLHRLCPRIPRGRRRQFAFLHRLPCFAIHLTPERRHQRHRQKQRQPQQHLIRRRRLRPERLPQKMQHNRNPQERRQRHDDGRQQREQRQQNHDLHRRTRVFGQNRRNHSTSFTSQQPGPVTTSHSFSPTRTRCKACCPPRGIRSIVCICFGSFRSSLSSRSPIYVSVGKSVIRTPMMFSIITISP